MRPIRWIAALVAVLAPVTGRAQTVKAEELDSIIRKAVTEKQLIGVVNTGVPDSSYSTVMVTDPINDKYSEGVLKVYNRAPSTYGAGSVWLTSDGTTPVAHVASVSTATSKSGNELSR